MVSVKTKTGVPKDAGRWILEFWPGSVGQDIPAANAFGGQDVKRGLGEIVRRIAVVAVGPKRGLLVPKASGILPGLLLLGNDSPVCPFRLPDTHGFGVGIIEEGGWVRFPRTIEVVRLAAAIGSRLEAWVALGPACLQPMVFGHVGLE